MQEEHIPRTEAIESIAVTSEVTAPIVSETSESETKTNKGITIRPHDILRSHLEQAAKENNQSINQWLTNHLESHFTGAKAAIDHKLDRILELLGEQLPPAQANFQTLREQADAFAKTGLQIQRKTLQKDQPSHAHSTPTHSTMLSPLSPAHKNRGF